MPEALNTKSVKTKSVTNPHGANQWRADPRQALFLAYYLDPKSPTFSNAYQSGLKAGFEEEYAKSITAKMPNWLAENVNDSKALSLLEKAERNLDTIMDLPDKVQAMGAFGPLYEGKGNSKKPIMVHATSLLKIKNDASQFLAERIGRKRYGKDVPIIPPSNTTIMNIVINPPRKNEDE